MKRVLVVGGGSAGWMTAAYLDAALNRGDDKTAEISVIESPDVPRIGVGEATIPSILHILAVIGIEEKEFMRRTDATFKQSIKFTNWLNNNDSYYHAFGRFTPGPIDDSGLRWLMSNRSIPFMETVSAQPAICEMNLSPKMLGSWDFGARLTYAYHMNALKFADFLCEIATGRGVSHYVDHVTDVEMAESGDIVAVNTRAGQRLEADLFVDCTGFAALLIEKQMGVKWTDCSQWLLCDRAVTMRVPHEHYYPGYIRPYTTSTALSSGWIWEIPLQDARSLGYVHSSAFISEEEAERELRAFDGLHTKALDSRTIHFKVGHREKAWVKNCVAIGLSSSFIEPLESTGLYLADLATAMLTEHFPHRGNMELLAFRFNRIMSNRFYEILDFINMHYCLTQRVDTEFWREVRRPERINDRLKAKLEFWRNKPVTNIDFENQFFPGQSNASANLTDITGDSRPAVDTGKLFTRSSYEAVMYGMDFLHDECRQWYGNSRPPSEAYAPILKRLPMAAQKLPPHDVWLQRVLGMPDYR